ncbi:alpha-N-acetyl-neuraminyl-2,3-beta-galactosyl-1,3-N-acetyl-galactosaminide alpha-2,6-sialyltransferase-like [Amphiura filiformis]|uniref:alpha-N-acetyl-neuraminyl-2,3-beta-galactosyl-1, 3-N-acetyl-galactosaminide alpha-2,6-sialyltransferase-like n=1 Tax=Amphiura filiformis TaxID=82378 RepID=UPI003B2114FE
MVPQRRWFGVGRDKLLLVLFWYSCLMSVGFLYFAHEKTEYNTFVSVIQRGVVGDNDFVAVPSSKHYSSTRKAHVAVASSPTPSGAKHAKQDLRTELEIVHVEVAEPTEPDTTPSHELEGYVDVINGSNLNFHCSQCTVVSSSGQLLNRSGGRDIDKSECVIRMNSAPVRGYQDDVGSRTTVRVIGHVNLGKGLHNNTELQKELFGDVHERPDIVIIPWLYAIKINRTTDRAWNTAQNLSRTFPDVKFYVLTSEKMNFSEEIFTKEVGISRREAHTWLSTGWMTMLFALDACDSIDLYGLVPEDHCQTHPNDTSLYHYFEPDFRKECDYYKASEGVLRYGHKFITEKAVFAKWSRTFGNIQFHYPSWIAKPSNSTFLDTPFLRTYREALLNGSLAELQAIPSKKKKKTVIVRKKKIIKIVRRKKRVQKPVVSSDAVSHKEDGYGDVSAAARIEETALALSNDRDIEDIVKGARDPESLKRAELMRMARRKIIRSRRHKPGDLQP